MADETAVPPAAHDPMLAELTEPQREAVTHVDGPLLVLAGPGSGKTRVITHRLAHLIRRVGVAPWNVLAITFTNKAAAEMRERAATLLSQGQARAATIATFHSLCARLLRHYARHLGLPPGYSIYDSGDQQRAIKQALSELELSTTNYPPGTVLSRISNAKNELLDADAFSAKAGDFFERVVARVYAKYTKILDRNNALDFDDLLLQTVRLFREHPDVLAELQQRYQYVLIDEYQDTNHAQFMIASALAASHKNLCATGDPDQSIYGWRGADLQNILDFESHYPDAKVVRLEQNYRSTGRILAAADALIQHNHARKHKALWTENDPGEPVRVLTTYSETHEAARLVETFRQLHDREHVPWGSMAVFYRMNSLSRVVEDALRDAGIPYQIARGTAFYERAEIRNAVAYLHTIVNPADEVNLLRVINVPTRGIGDRTVKAVQAHALAADVPIDQVIEHPAQVPSLGARAQSALAKFHRMVQSWRDDAGFNDQDEQQQQQQQQGQLAAMEENVHFEPALAPFVQRVLDESGLTELYRNDRSDPDQERLANLGEFITFAQQFERDYQNELEEAGEQREPALAEKLLAFLERISLIADVDAVQDHEGEREGEVTLMTLHAAKGLEFDAVAIVGAEDGLLPHQRAERNEMGREEERRLCFVGITRARRHLLLTHARFRTLFGRTIPTIPSSFLGELPTDDIAWQDVSNEPDAEDHMRHHTFQTRRF